MSEPGKGDPQNGQRSILRTIDDGIFAVEMTILWTFLAVSAVMVFLDVAYRRLAAPDSKIGELVVRIFGVESPTAIETINQWAPTGSAVVGVVLLWFAYWTAENQSSDGREPSSKRPVLYAAGTAAFLGLLGWIMLRPEVPSKYFYLLLYTLGGGTWLVYLLRNKPSGWPGKLLALVIVTALFLYIALNYFPDGYSWSKELSLIMLLWVGFLGASVCAHEGKHIYMGALQRLVPASLKKWISALGYLVTAAFCCYMMLLGYVYAKEAIGLEGRFEQTNIPDWVATIAVPAAFAMTMLRYIAAAISSLTGGTYGAPPVDESVAAAAEVAGEQEAEA